jgi:hypothetical protein
VSAGAHGTPDADGSRAAARQAATTSDDILNVRVGNRTIGENLQQVIAAGVLRQGDDGSLTLVPPNSPDLFMKILNGRAPPCGFLNRFMFRMIYEEAAVPAGCEHCYKIKVVPRTLRQLVAGYEIALGIDRVSKWGIDFYNRYNQDTYAGYFYFDGLEGARALFPHLRKAVDEHGKLGPDVPVLIKRGCSNYEAVLGPSDTFAFRPELRDIEDYLRSRLRMEKDKPNALAPLLYGKWVPFAFQIGDETYLDFTDGKPLYRKSLTYEP